MLAADVRRQQGHEARQRVGLEAEPLERRGALGDVVDRDPPAEGLCRRVIERLAAVRAAVPFEPCHLVTQLFSEPLE